MVGVLVLEPPVGLGALCVGLGALCVGLGLLEPCEVGFVDAVGVDFVGVVLAGVVGVRFVAVVVLVVVVVEEAEPLDCDRADAELEPDELAGVAECPSIGAAPPPEPASAPALAETDCEESAPEDCG